MTTINGLDPVPREDDNVSPKFKDVGPERRVQIIEVRVHTPGAPLKKPPGERDGTEPKHVVIDTKRTSHRQSTFKPTTSSGNWVLTFPF